MPRALLLALDHVLDIVGGREIRSKPLTYLVGAVTDDHMDRLGFERTGRLDDMTQQSASTQLMQHFGALGAHPRSVTGGENDDFQRRNVLRSITHSKESMP